jgi:hypothetical protein
MYASRISTTDSKRFSITTVVGIASPSDEELEFSPEPQLVSTKRNAEKSRPDTPAVTVDVFFAPMASITCPFQTNT